MIEHFSTRHVESVERLDFWNNLMAETYSGLVVDPRHALFHAQFSRWNLGELTLAWPKSAAASVTRRNLSHDTDQTVILHLIQSGTCTLQQRKLTRTLRPGDMIVCAGEEFYRFDMSSEHQVLIVEMDRGAIADRCPQIDERIATVISGQHAPTRLLHNYLLSLWREGAANFDEAMGDAYSGILMDLFARSLEATGAECGAGRNALVARMKGIVEARLDDEGLTPTSLASEMGVSLRTLQNAAAECGTTPVAYIANRRLELAAQRLVMDKTQSITEIAYASGFSDSAYFSRRFHARFGLSPSQYRSRH